MKRKMTISMEESIADKLDAYCKKTGISRSNLITYLVATTFETTEQVIKVTAREIAKEHE